MAFEENSILFGHDPEPGIVAAEFDGIDKVTLYLRQKDGSTASRTERSGLFYGRRRNGGGYAGSGPRWRAI